MTSPFARHLGRPVRRFSALDAFRLQQALPGVDLVPPRGPGRPSKHSDSPAGVKRSVTPAGLAECRGAV
ncbi:MAG: hypothetical protein K2Y10_03960 [Burkholderiaceae bacterium]|nr:hypothetical protein [Burkholderiaceae bacterium]